MRNSKWRAFDEMWRQANSATRRGYQNPTHEERRAALSDQIWKLAVKLTCEDIYNLGDIIEDAYALGKLDALGE